ncbi:MAG: BamA/TamA family outer membrane protein [Ignavibacteriales bacterium]|nr:BamA/TamA family outer membrane protein [Ignavibacteriales bacterium]
MARTFWIFLTALVLFTPPMLSQSPAGTSHRVFTIQPVFEGTSEKFPNIVNSRRVKRPKVAVVLSGGGARGIAAIGVFRSLEKNNIPVDFVVGTSIGSIIGGLYAAGYSTVQLEGLVDSTNWDEVLSFTEDSRRSEMFLDQKIIQERSVLVLRFDGLEPIIPSAFSTGQRLTHYLNILTLQGLYQPDRSFDQLKVAYRAVTTDLISGKRIVIESGDLTEAMRASVTVPLLFSTVRKDTLELLDGGLVSNIPVDVARQWGANIVVAVDLTSPLRTASQLNAPWEFADQLMGIMMQESNKRALALADIVVKPDLGNHLSTDFTSLDVLMKKGEEASDSAVGRLSERYNSLLVAQAVSGMAELRKPKFFSQEELPVELKALEARESVSEAELHSFVTSMYQSGSYESVELVVHDDKESTDVEVRALSYPVLNDVEFTGNHHIPGDSLRSLFLPLLGKRMNSSATRTALEQVLATYRKHGYCLARIQDVDLNRSSGVAKITMDEGLVIRMEIEGTKETRDYVIWRELPFRDGQILKILDVAQGIRNVYGTGLFEQVVVSARREAEGNIVRIKARERSTDLIRLGLRIDNERNVQPSIDVRDENLLGNGAELGVRFSGGARNRTFLAEFKATRIFDSYLTMNLKGYSLMREVNVYEDDASLKGDPLHWDRVRVGEYRELREGGSLSFGTQLERLGSVTVEGRLEKHRILSIFNQPVQNESYKISSIKFGTTVDTQNKFPYPTDGALLNFTYETALVKVTDAIGFTKMSFAYEKYQTLFHRHVLRPKIFLGVADETTPLSEEFGFGGQQNFFGLREDNARGRQMVVASLEYTYQSPFSLFFDTYLKARYDLGAVWATPEQIRLVDFLHGIGVGVAFDTPIGPAEFSVGRSFFFRKELLDNPVSLGPFVAYFSIGYPF